MAHYRQFGFVLFFLCLLMLSSASKILLTTSSAAIQEGRTDTLRLKCSLQDTEKQVWHTLESSTNYKLENVNSIIVSRTGSDGASKPVAKITAFTPAEAVADLENLSVAGTVHSNNPDGSPSLELTWSKPGEMQAGDYTCEVFALDPSGRCVSLYTHTVVEINVPGLCKDDDEIADFMKTINDVHNKTNRVMSDDFRGRGIEVNDPVNVMNYTVTGSANVLENTLGGRVNALSNTMNGRTLNVFRNTLSGRFNVLNNTNNGGGNVLNNTMNGKVNIMNNVMNYRVNVLNITMDGCVNIVNNTIHGSVNVLNITMNGCVNIVTNTVYGSVNVLYLRMNGRENVYNNTGFFTFRPTINEVVKTWKLPNSEEEC